MLRAEFPSAFRFGDLPLLLGSIKSQKDKKGLLQDAEVELLHSYYKSLALYCFQQSKRSMICIKKWCWQETCVYLHSTKRVKRDFGKFSCA